MKGLEGFRPRREGIRSLLVLPGLDAALLAQAQEIADRARARAPVVTGRYQASIRAQTVAGRSKRAAAEVYAAAPYAGSVEASHRVLGRAIGGGG